MKLYKYKIFLLDPLFYSLEGLSGCYPPPYLHATAINSAYSSAHNISPEKQPYIMSNANGGRNIPRYENSYITKLFYFTPAFPKSEIQYFPENVKGDSDILKTAKGEVLRISLLFFIPPETEFIGYCYINEEIEKLSLIRLGSFRGKAKILFEEVQYISEAGSRKISHPVDPFVSDVARGVMVNILPYPIIINPICKNTIKIKENNYFKYISLPLPIKQFTDAQVSYEGRISLPNRLI